MQSPITTHVLDTSRGCPAEGIRVILSFLAEASQWTQLSENVTDDDGRISDLLPINYPLKPGTYRITFEVESYFERHGQPAFYPTISVVFSLAKPEAHYHVPLLLNPFGYSTYRGS